MLSTVLIGVLSVVAILGFAQYRSLQKRISDAKTSGFKYIISPIYFEFIPWIILQEGLVPLLSKLPSSWTQPWLSFSLFFRSWHTGYEPFRKVGEDTVMVVSPGGNVLWTCDAEVIMQVSDRRNDFLKPIHMLGMLNIFGPTITASEGEEHRLYKKAASPAFNESTHGNVCIETIRQSNMMLDEWLQNGGEIPNLNRDAAKLALHVLSAVFFNKTMQWTDDAKSLPPGHTLSYHRAISAVFEHNNTLFMTPPTVLNNSPFQGHKLAKQAFVEWRKYMEEMRDETVNHLKQQGAEKRGDLLESLVEAGTPELGEADSAISPAAVLGNIFIFVLAGHETSANLFATALSLLACKPKFQKALQVDLDNILGGRSVRDLSYPDDHVKLMSGHVGALMKETLRHYGALPFLPKTNLDRPQILKSRKQSHVVPANTLIMMSTSAVHRNPKYWPNVSPSSYDSYPYPVSSFAPERWLQSAGKEAFNPEPGAYIPFAEGYRSCIGQRFAQVEFCAAIANVFSEHSIELAVKDGQKFEDVLRNAEQQLSSGIGSEMGLKMTKPVPLKVIKRVK